MTEPERREMGACQHGDAAITEGGCDAATIRMPRGCAAHGVVQAQAGEGREAAALVRPCAHAAVAAAGRQQFAAVRLRAEAEDVARLPALGDAPCSGIRCMSSNGCIEPVQRHRNPANKNRLHVESIERKNVCLIHQAEGIGSNPPSVAVTVAWRQVLLVAAELKCDTVSSL